MSRGFRICVENMGIESLRPSYGRPKLTLISSIAEVVDFSFNQFHSQFLPNNFAFCQFVIVILEVVDFSFNQFHSQFLPNDFEFC